MRTNLPSIPTQKQRTAEESIAGQWIPIKYYQPKDTSRLAKLTFRNLGDLSTTQNDSSDTYLDLLWHALYFKAESRTQRTSWNGCMQNISKGPYPGNSVVSMLPIIDLDPTGMKCIYSTLIFIVQQATPLHIDTPVVTFDQPLW